MSIQQKITPIHGYLINKENGVILMEFDVKNVEFENQKKNESGDSAKISENQVTEN